MRFCPDARWIERNPAKAVRPPNSYAIADAAFEPEDVENLKVTQRTQRETTLLISRSQSTELAITAQNTQSCGLKLTVPNAR